MINSGFTVKDLYVFQLNQFRIIVSLLKDKRWDRQSSLQRVRNSYHHLDLSPVVAGSVGAVVACEA